MKTCDTCKHYNRILVPCYGCINMSAWEPKQQTHADRIRAMTDEELAEMHVGIGCPPGTDLNELCFDENGEELLCTPPRCRECWFKWLRQEAMEEP